MTGPNLIDRCDLVETLVLSELDRSAISSRIVLDKNIPH